jgi:tetratricopeptide (TPR) repeat protein
MSTEGLADLDARWIIDQDSEGARRALSLPRLPAEDQGRELLRLGEVAQEGSAHDLHMYALGYCLIGLLEAGIELLNLLVARYPDSVEIRLNLALAYELVHLPALALDQLALAVPASAGTAVEDLAKARYAAAVARQREHEADVKFLQLRAAMLREEDPSAETLRELGLTLFDLVRTPGGEMSATEALAVLELAHQAAPKDAEVLEYLAALYLITERTVDRERILRELAMVAPASRALETSSESHEAGDRDLLQRKLLLMERLAAPGGPSAGVIAELRKLAQMLPRNPDYQTMLMHALSGQGDKDAALRIAEELEREFPGSHNVHFNIAQQFWRTGDRERAERHLVEALSTAEDDQDREDVANLRRLLEGDANG